MGTPGNPEEETRPLQPSAPAAPPSIPPAAPLPDASPAGQPYTWATMPPSAPAPAAPPAPAYTPVPASAAPAASAQPTAAAAPPVGVPPAPPRGKAPKARGRGGKRPLLIGLAALVVLLVAAGGVLFYGYAQAKQPIEAAQAFCADLKAQRYDAAYTRFSEAYRTRQDSHGFQTAALLHDQVDGKVTDCGLPGIGSNFRFDLGGATTATFDARVERAGGGSFEGAVSLVKSGGAWRVNGLDDALLGTDVVPLQTGQFLCAALVAGNYPAAYTLYSAREQRAFGSQQDYTTTFANAFGGPLKLTECVPDLKSYTAAGATARLDVHLTLSETTTLGTQSIAVPTPVTLRFTQENGAWKVDRFDLNIPNA